MTTIKKKSFQPNFDLPGSVRNSAMADCYLLTHDRYELMTECWKEDPSTRPSFSELIDRLEVMMTKDVPYCDLSKHDESREYYNVPDKAVYDK